MGLFGGKLFGQRPQPGDWAGEAGPADDTAAILGGPRPGGKDEMLAMFIRALLANTGRKSARAEGEVEMKDGGGFGGGFLRGLL